MKKTKPKKLLTVLLTLYLALSIVPITAYAGVTDVIGDNTTKPYSHFYIDTWLFANYVAEWSYLRLIKLGWKPQQARTILPLDTHSELIHTAFVSDWKHFIDLRSNGTTGAPNPDMKKVADMLKDEFIELKYYDR